MAGELPSTVALPTHFFAPKVRRQRESVGALSELFTKDEPVLCAEHAAWLVWRGHHLIPTVQPLLLAWLFSVSRCPGTQAERLICFRHAASAYCLGALHTGVCGFVLIFSCHIVASSVLGGGAVPLWWPAAAGMAAVRPYMEDS